MSKILITALHFLLLLTAGTASAYQMPPEPAACPQASVIQATPFLQINHADNGTYTALSLSTFNSSDYWGFVIARITAKNLQDAKQKALAALSTLAFAAGPQWSNTAEVWACSYYNRLGYPAVAFTPVRMAASINPKILRDTVNSIEN